MLNRAYFRSKEFARLTDYSKLNVAKEYLSTCSDGEVREFYDLAANQYNEFNAYNPLYEAAVEEIELRGLPRRLHPMEKRRRYIDPNYDD